MAVAAMTLAVAVTVMLPEAVLSAGPEGCATELAQLCKPWGAPYKCGACARSNVNKLAEAGCTYELVDALCLGGQKACVAELKADCGNWTSWSKCEECAQEHATDLNAAGCNPSQISAICHGPAPGPPPGPPSDRPVRKVLLDVTSGSGSHCLDGSPAGFYYQPANPNGTLQDVWVISMEGGGDCATQESCQERAKTDLGSSTMWAATASCTLCNPDKSENPYFADAHSVYIPYCSGDVHGGQRTEASAETWGLYFQGHLNVVRILELLKQQFGISNATKVLVTGGSAGGIGTNLNSDYIQSQLPGVIVKAAPDAGWFFPADPQALPAGCGFPNIFDDFAKNQHTKWDNSTAVLWQSYAPPACEAHYRAIGLPTWFCGSQHNLYPWINVPMFIVENMYDTNQIFTQLGAPKETNHMNATIKFEVNQFIARYGDLMRNSTAQVIRKGNHSVGLGGMFLASCLSHGMGAATSIGGVTWIEAVGDWFFEQNKYPRFHVDTCRSSDGLPCNPSCTTTIST